MALPDRRRRAVVVGLAALLAAAPAAAGDVPHGREIYDVRCAACHGDTGAGDGPAAAALVPRPRNFRDPAFWKGRTAVQLRLVVKHGRPGTMMQPFDGVLSEDEIDDVIAYVQTFRPAADAAPAP
jgi:mono/diheme cytochrome c family protein